MKSLESSPLPGVLLGVAAGAAGLSASSAHAAAVATTLATPITIGLTNASGASANNSGIGAIYFDPRTGFAQANQTQADATTAQAEGNGINADFSLGYGARGTNGKGASTANHPIFNALASGSQLGSVLGTTGQPVPNANTPFLASRLAQGATINAATGMYMAAAAATTVTATMHDNNANDPNTYPYNSGAGVNDSTRGYIGISFLANGSTPGVAAGTTLYGWADVEYGGFDERLTLYGFGYETSGGAAIAGAVPEPTTLVSCALAGAAGLLAARRRRAAGAPTLSA